MRVSPLEKYRSRVDEVAALKVELEAASRPEPAPAVGRLLEAAGDLLRRRARVPVDEGAIDAALRAVPETGLHAWLDGVKASDVLSALRRAADQAVEAAIPEQPADVPTLASWAMQALMVRDRFESARCCLERMAAHGRPGAQVALQRLSRELAAADEHARPLATRLTALNADRRDELAILDVERRQVAWWLSEKSGLEHDLVVKVLGGEARGTVPASAQRAHDVVMQKRSRRFSFDELLRFDLGLAGSGDEQSIRAAAQGDPELALALRAIEEGERAIEELSGGAVTGDRDSSQTAARTPGATGAPEVVEERTEFKLLVLRTRHQVQVVVQPRRQDRFAAAAVYLSAHPLRSVPFVAGEHGLHFDLGPSERVRGQTARVVVKLSDGRDVTTDVGL